MTAEQIQSRIDELNEAYSAVLRSQEYTAADGRKLRRADLETISSEIERWERKLLRATRRGPVAKQVIAHGV